MKSKICSTCNISKDLKSFNKRTAYTHGFNSECKECESLRAKNYRRSKNGLITQIYSHQKSNSILRGHIKPTYSKKELSEWLYSQELFHKLYDNWKRLDYQKEYTPSVDRKDDYIGYTLANIQLTTWEDNRSKLHKDRLHGKNTKNNSKKVYQFTKDGEYIAEYHSNLEAQRVTGIDNANISMVCNGKRKSAGKFMWSYSASILKDK